jgi:hypothetical protein
MNGYPPLAETTMTLIALFFLGTTAGLGYLASRP